MKTRADLIFASCSPLAFVLSCAMMLAGDPQKYFTYLGYAVFNAVICVIWTFLWRDIRNE